MKDDSPCKECKPPKRYPGCHDHCEEGLAWDEKVKEEKEKIRKIKNKEKLIGEYKIEMRVKAFKKRRK